MLLDGKVAIVTGGDSGIGHAICLALASEGAAVTINYHKNQAAAEATLKEVTDAGGKGQIVQGDVSQVADLQKLVDATVEAFGKLDVMVNNAGMETRTSILDHHRKAVRSGDLRRPQERLLRHTGRRPAVSQARQWRARHQYLVDSRRLADAGQHRLLLRQGRHPHADAHRRRRARARMACSWSTSPPAPSRRRLTRRRWRTRR